MASTTSERLKDIQQKALVEGLICLYRDQILCDATLEAENEQVGVHKSILVACSPYFKAMFGFESEHSAKTIKLQNISGPVLRDIVTFLYSGDIDVNNDNVQALLSAANMLQIEPLLNFCVEYMSNALCAENCLEVLIFADFLCLPTLKEKAQKSVLENFTHVYQTEQFCMLDKDSVSALLKSDDLNIENEEIVFEAVMAWIEHDLEARTKDLFKLFSCIRFPLLESSYINKIVTPNKLISENDICSYLLKRLPDFQSGQPSPFSDSRRLGMYIKDMFIFSGGAFSFTERAFTCVDPETHKSYVSIEPHPSFDFKFKLDLYKLVVTPNNEIFCIGGVFYDDYHFQRESAKALSAVLEYEQKTQKWQARPSLPTGRCGFAVTCHGGKIYVFGGYQYYPRDPPTEETWCYDTEMEVWTERDSMPLKLALQASVTVKDSAFLFGGKDEVDECMPLVLQYGYKSNQWNLLDKSIPIPMSEGTAINFKDKIYLLGGSNSNGYIVNVFLFDPERQRWTFCSEFPTHRKLLSIVRGRNSIYVFGGIKHVHSRGGISRRGTIVESKDLFRYDIDLDVWIKESRLIELSNCYASNVASVNTKFLVESKRMKGDTE